MPQLVKSSQPIAMYTLKCDCKCINTSVHLYLAIPGLGLLLFKIHKSQNLNFMGEIRMKIKENVVKDSSSSGKGSWQCCDQKPNLKVNVSKRQ